eukprot:9482842-Pyramimonas_sp.AAC.1
MIVGSDGEEDGHVSDGGWDDACGDGDGVMNTTLATIVAPVVTRAMRNRVGTHPSFRRYWLMTSLSVVKRV